MSASRTTASAATEAAVLAALAAASRVAAFARRVFQSSPPHTAAATARAAVHRRRVGCMSGQSVGGARYGNVVPNGLSFAPTLSVQSGSANGAQLAVDASPSASLRNVLKIAVSPTSTTSSPRRRPPQPGPAARPSPDTAPYTAFTCGTQLNQPAVAAGLLVSTMSMSEFAYSTLASRSARACGRPATFMMNDLVCAMNEVGAYGIVRLYASWFAFTMVTSLTSGLPRNSTCSYTLEEFEL